MKLFFAEANNLLNNIFVFGHSHQSNMEYFFVFTTVMCVLFFQDQNMEASSLTEEVRKAKEVCCQTACNCLH